MIYMSGTERIGIDTQKQKKKKKKQTEERKRIEIQKKRRMVAPKPTQTRKDIEGAVCRKKRKALSWIPPSKNLPGKRKQGNGFESKEWVKRA